MAVSVDVFFLGTSVQVLLIGISPAFCDGEAQAEDHSIRAHVPSPTGEELTAAMRKVWLDLPWPDESGISSRSIVVDERNAGCLLSFGEVFL